MIDLIELSKTSYEDANKRMENGANIKTDTVSMLKHCATEVVEAMQAYTLFHEALLSIDYTEQFMNFRAELADIICCVLIIAAKEQIDIEKDILKCMEKNRNRAELKGDKL